MAPHRRRADASRSRQRALLARAARGARAGAPLGRGRTRALAAPRTRADGARRRGVRRRDDERREIRAYRASSNVLPFDLLGNSERRGPPSAIDNLLDRLTLETMLQGLTPLERQIVVLIHLDGITVVEAAARLGYSRRHVTRLHRAALERLKRSSEVGAASRAEGC